MMKVKVFFACVAAAFNIIYMCIYVYLHCQLVAVTAVAVAAATF